MTIKTHATHGFQAGGFVRVPPWFKRRRSFGERFREWLRCPWRWPSAMVDTGDDGPEYTVTVAKGNTFELGEADDNRREGMYGEWEWDSMWKCWRHNIPLCIYPGEDGTFTVSSNQCWHSGRFTTFEAAEIEAFGISPEQAKQDAEAYETR